MGDTNGDGKSDLISTNAAGDVWIQVSGAGRARRAWLASLRLESFRVAGCV